MYNLFTPGIWRKAPLMLLTRCQNFSPVHLGASFAPKIQHPQQNEEGTLLNTEDAESEGCVNQRTIST